MKKNEAIYWAPRILSIFLILFLALFSLDVFSPEFTVQEMAIGFLMHNIPVFILTILLAIAWKYDLVGAVAFFTAGLLYIGLIMRNAFAGQFEWFMVVWALQLSGPAFLISALYLIGWQKKKI